MLVKILGIADILAAASFLLFGFGKIEWVIPFMFVMYIIIKAIAYRDIVGFADVAAALIVALSFIQVYWVFGYVLAVIWILQKGIFSLI